MDNVLHLIEQYGYLIVFFGVMLESVGIPIPGETILIASGVLAHRGTLGLGEVILFGVLGAVVGDQIGYWIGREGGRRFVLRWGRYVHVTPERLSRAEDFFVRHGGKAVFLARFVAGLRVFGALVAGISRMHWRTFFLYNVLGGATWATAAILAGYLLGGSLGLLDRWLGRATLLLAGLFLLALSLYASYRWASNHPEQLARLARRLGGGYLQAFLRSPAGLWVRRRLSPGEVYGLYLTAGLAATALFSWAFGGIVQDIVARDPLVRVDVAILRFLRSRSEPYLAPPATALDTLLSSGTLLTAGTIIGITLLAAAWKRREFRPGFYGSVLLAATLGAWTLSALFEVLFHRPAPPAQLRIVSAAGEFGFPSSAALSAVAVGVAVWYVFSLRPPESRGGSWRAKTRVGLAVVSVALVSGLVQVYTGTHYPSDVLAGWALGGLWASVCLTAAEVFRRLREDKPRRQTE